MDIGNGGTLKVSLHDGVIISELKDITLFARIKNGLMVQILSGLITYLFLAIYCQEQQGESVSIRRVRQLRDQIQNEATQQAMEKTSVQNPETKKAH